MGSHAKKLGVDMSKYLPSWALCFICCGTFDKALNFNLSFLRCEMGLFYHELDYHGYNKMSHKFNWQFKFDILFH